MLVEEQQDVGALLRIGEAGEGHLRARRRRCAAISASALIVSQSQVPPWLRSAFGISEAGAVGDGGRPSRPTGSGRCRWRRPDRQCGRRCICGTRPAPRPASAVCRKWAIGCSAAARLGAVLLDAGDRIAHRLGPLGLEDFAGDEGRAEQDDARAQHPSRNRVEPTVHAGRPFRGALIGAPFMRARAPGASHAVAPAGAAFLPPLSSLSTGGLGFYSPIFRDSFPDVAETISRQRGKAFPATA